MPSTAQPLLLEVPRCTIALIAANGLSAACQGQFMLVLPWMLLERGHSPAVSALATGFVFVPLVAFAVPAGLIADRTDPVRIFRIALVAIFAETAIFGGPFAGCFCIASAAATLCWRESAH